MARICLICGKRPRIGCNVSHSNRHTKRKIYPNLKKTTFLYKGKRSKGYVCTGCLGKITKIV